MLGTAKRSCANTVTPLVAAFTLLLALCTACGGSAEMSTDPANGIWPRHSWEDAARSGSFQAVAIDASGELDAPLSRQLAISTEPAGANTRVRIHASELSEAEHAYLHLAYDAKAMHPVLSQAGTGLASKVLFLGLHSEPGVVEMGLHILPGAEYLRGDCELALLEFAPGQARPVKRISTATTSTISDLRFDNTNTDTLEFTYNTKGDYDQNSEVNVADLTPVAAHYQKTLAASDWQAARVADGDSNTEINISDLTPIAANFRLRCTGWQIQSGPADSGPWGDVSGGSIAQSSGVKPAGGGYMEYSFAVGNPVADAWYSLVALDGSERAAGRSNAVQYGAAAQVLPPTNLTAVKNGTQVELSWQAPASGTPDFYRTYIGSNLALSDAQQLGDNISAFSYMVSALFSPDAEWYFGVSAVYGAQESAYTVVHYGSVANDAPQQLTATRSTDHIALQWALPASGSPDGYNAYIGSDAAMSDGFKMNGGTPIVGLNYDCSTLFSPDNPYYFGVKAVYGGSESDYSNIFFYDPSGGGGDDVTPPVWQGGVGIRAVTPDDGFAVVEWWPAVDADTPPVQYLLYVVPATDPIDWNNPRDIFPGSTLETNVINLTNNTAYKFAVRAADSVAPTANVTTNTNEIISTPMVFPPDGNIGTIQSSDTACAIMPGEEIPRIACVNHTSELWYVKWDGAQWQSVDLNATLNIAARKYHPQMLAIGDNVHIAFATPSSVYEVYGQKDADPATWTLNTVSSSNINGVFGIGFDYNATEGYLAMVFATDSGGEKLFYTDRNLVGAWMIPFSIMDGNPEIWQCDLALNDNDGSQWLSASNGYADGTGDFLKFWYGSRVDRAGTWNVSNTGYGGDVMDVEIDPSVNMPCVLCAEVRDVDTGFGNQPVSDATVFSWTGSTWVKSVIEQGDATVDLGSGTYDTVYAGQDPVLMFNPDGTRGVGVWSTLDFLANILEDTADLTGEWRQSVRTSTTWPPGSQFNLFIPSGSSGQASTAFFHCATSNLGMADSGTTGEMSGKYSDRNNYVVGDLYYAHGSL